MQPYIDWIIFGMSGLLIGGALGMFAQITREERAAAVPPCKARCGKKQCDDKS